MDNAALSALFAQQAPPQAAPQGVPGEADAAQLLAQEQTLNPRLQENNGTGMPAPGATGDQPEVADVLPQQRNSEEEDPKQERVIPKAIKPEKKKAQPQLDEMVLVGLMGTPEQRETVQRPLKNLDNEHLTRIMMQGDNSEGLFKPKESSILEETKLKKLHEKIDEVAQIKKTSETKTLGKYETQFREDILKNPQNYKLNTPRGEMSLQECFKNGYRPDTQTFGESPKQMLERHLQGLPPQEQEALRNLVNVESLGLKPKDAEARGIAASPEMLAQQAEIAQGAPAVPQTDVPLGLPQEGGNV